MVGWFGLIWFVNSYLLFQNMHLEINTPYFGNEEGGILSFIPPKGKVIFSSNSGFFRYIDISLAVDES